MESRVLTGATIRGLALPPKLTARLSGNFSFPSVRLTGKISDGGNLVCGRQLRPDILLEASPASVGSPITRRDSLRPCCAAASERSDSDGAAKVGFLEKYPALVTGFFFFMYFLNVIFNILNKKIYNYFPYPYFVSVIHLFVGVVYCLISWALGLPKRAPMDSNLLKLLIPVAVCHALGHVTSNVFFAAVAVSFTHILLKRLSHSSMLPPHNSYSDSRSRSRYGCLWLQLL